MDQHPDLQPLYLPRYQSQPGHLNSKRHRSRWTHFHLSILHTFSTQVNTHETPGGSVKIIDPTVFPIASKFSAALVTIKPGALMEIHWHTSSDEWSCFIGGSARIGIYAAQGNAQTFDFHAGDVGYIPKAMTHYVENVWEEDVVFLEVLQADHFSGMVFLVILSSSIVVTWLATSKRGMNQCLREEQISQLVSGLVLCQLKLRWILSTSRTRLSRRFRRRSSILFKELSLLDVSVLETLDSFMYLTLHFIPFKLEIYIHFYVSLPVCSDYNQHASLDDHFCVPTKLLRHLIKALKPNWKLVVLD